MKITKRQLRRIIKEAVGGTVQIAGRTVKLANEESIRNMVGKASARDRGKRYSDTHSFRGSEEDETPEETVERLVRSSIGMPGSVTIYQDPDTGNVFGYAKYNTF
tara:strand:+ start:1189 stop:1503 length:315 start_codon:yes stop_codon:yes gene_type:complete